MHNFFQQIYHGLNRPDNHMIIMVVFIALVVVAIVLRVAAHLHYRAALLSFFIDGKKGIGDKADVAKIKNKLLRKVVAEYIRTGERAATEVPAVQLVDRGIAGMSFLGWRYEAILPFVKTLEMGFIWVGLVLAMAFADYAFMYGTLAVLAFLLTRITGAFFDVTGAKKQLADEMVLFITREIGRFFATDTSGAILRLKNDLTQVIDNQSLAYKETMENIGHIMATALGKVSDSMVAATTSLGPTVAEAMDEKLINMNDSLNTTLKNWEKAIGEATRLQTDMNQASDKLSHAGGKLQSASELLAAHMQGHSSALSAQLVSLVGAVDAIKESTTHFAAGQEALISQGKYIERNQQTLETSLESYEASLQGLTQSLGDALGAFVNLHAQTSAQAIHDALKTNVDIIMNAQRNLGGGRHHD